VYLASVHFLNTAEENQNKIKPPTMTITARGKEERKESREENIIM
jgi:hypothetical protein